LLVQEGSSDQCHLSPKPSQPVPACSSTHATVATSTFRHASSGFESDSSSDTQSRSSTPRPSCAKSQPLITISLSPDNLSDYENLFYRPPPQDSDPTPNPTPPSTGQTPASQLQAEQFSELPTYMIKVMNDVANLEKKINDLEKEVARNDEELKGLRRIASNHLLLESS